MRIFQTVLLLLIYSVSLITFNETRSFRKSTKYYLTMLVDSVLSEIYETLPDRLDFELLTLKEDPVDINFWKDQTFENFGELRRLRIEESCQVSADDILRVVKESRWLRELSLSYSLLNDEILMAISADDHVRLETMRIEISSDSKSSSTISDETWLTFNTNSPDINIVLDSYLEGEEDSHDLISPLVPITHLHLGGFPSAGIIRKIGEKCPRIVELVIGSYDSGTIDEDLITIAKSCSQLSAVGLGDCDLTCSGLVEFVEICKERLRLLYVWETSLMEDKNYDIPAATSKISSLLGRTWTPEYVPPW